jgi:aquaporin Z
MPVQSMKIFAAELIGTTILMLGGPGSAILAGNEIGTFGVAFAFGLSLLIAAYIVGPISGCHINPAVTLGMAIARKTDTKLVPVYVVAQLVGAAIGGGIIFAIANGQAGFSASASGFATNGWADRSPSTPGFNFGAMLVVEIVFTAVLVYAVLASTTKKFSTLQGGVVVGFTLALIHLVTIPVDNTSVNPVRSFGAALWSGSSGAWEQLWAFIVFPLVGAVLGVFVFLLVDDARLEDTMLATSGTTKVRDSFAKATSRLTEPDEAEGVMLPEDSPQPDTRDVPRQTPRADV